MPELKTIYAQIGLPEGPRWREGHLWVSNMGQDKVIQMAEDGQIIQETSCPCTPSGLGWLPDGRLLLVLMEEQRIVSIDNGRLVDYADLSSLASYHCNDMLVSEEGFAYVGNFGYPAFEGGQAKHAELILVPIDGQPRIVAKELAFPNGMVVGPDAQTLVVAESLASRLTAFTIQANGDLTNRRIWAQFDQLGLQDEIEWSRVLPDGITMDAEGAIWIANPGADSSVLRVGEGGQILDRIDVAMGCYACMLGGPEGNTLFILGLDRSGENDELGYIKKTKVTVPKAGLP